MKSKELRLLLSMGSSRKLFIAAIIGGVINTAIVIGNGFLISAVIVGLIYHHPSTMQHIISMGALWLFRAIWVSQFDRWASLQASRLKAELRGSVTSSSQAVKTIPAAALTTLLLKGSNSLDIYVGRFLPQMIGAALTPLTVIATISILDLTSGLIALATIPLIPFFGALIGRFTNDAVAAKWQSLGTLGKYFEDSLRGIYTLAIFGRHKSQGDRIREMGDRYTDETMKVLRISFLSALVLELAATISVALIAVTIGLRLVGSSMEFFPALAVLVLAPEVYFPLRNAASLFHSSADGAEALSQLLGARGENEVEVRAREGSLGAELASPEWQSPYGGGKLPEFTLKSGEGVVIRGESGIGKTTFLMKVIEEESPQKKVGWIPQNPALIAGTIREIFTLVRPSVSDEEIYGYLHRVGIDLTWLPAGLDSLVGGTSEKSAQLSGGQRRRIAIARALAFEPSILIADEPTADLDPISAAEVLSILSEEMKAGKVIIAVLHAPDQEIVGTREIEMATS